MMSIGPHEECDEELIAMGEFINKMRPFNEWEEYTQYPKTLITTYIKLKLKWTI